MAGEGSKKGSEASLVPPRKINVQKFAESRASELETLHSVVSNRLNNDFRSRRNKRRRTTSFDNKAAKKRHRKKRKLGKVVNKSDAAAVSDQEKDKVTPRHIRRRVELRKNHGSGFSTSGDRTKRLRTHVWHAKRFTMTKLWGFHLPLGLQGRGRGSRALLKWYKQGAILHDASYCSALQLEGHEDSLMSVLRMVLEPSPSAQSEEVTNAIVSGAIYGSAMLHHVGAPISQLIAPVTYMWQPIHLEDEEISGHEYKSGGCKSPQSSESCSHRQLWVWIHASAFSEGYDALKFACQKQMNESGILINCFSLEGQLAKLEVMGSKAFQLLQKILHPVSCTSDNSWNLKKCAAREADNDSEFKKSSLLQIDESISSRSILSFTVRDPRALPHESVADNPMAVPTVVNSVSDCEPKKEVVVLGSPEKVKDLFPPLPSMPEGNSNRFNNMNLWDASSRITLPVEENVLCLEKHNLRLDFICLDDPKSKPASSSTEVQGSRSCPIMLLKNNNQMGLFMGWSIIVPLSWVRVFWISFISKGAHAIGLREKQWVSCEVGLPTFPSDFPDSNAYWSSMATVNTALDQKAEQQPPAVRLLKVPVPLPWNSVHVSVNKGLFAVQGTSTCSVKDTVDCNLSSNSRIGISNIASPNVSNLFHGIIARTSLVLTDFLKEVDGCRLLLFPQVPNGKMRFAELMMDENRCGHIQNGSSEITYDRKLCFVRVLLHAYKGGVFEEGAIICAPFPTDISLLTSRSEEGEAGLQIPESSVRSYFTEQASGKWELQLPESTAARESYRWPIGFVTTGFVRGSKKPVAEALCEAVVLARLREEQWNGTAVKQRRKEIYVLVRNMRSSKYRLGLASIVLEQQEDLDFL